MPNSPSVDDIYVVLRDCAKAKRLQTYMELSQAYQRRTGDWFEPHGSWDHALGELNRRLDAAGAPPLSAVVVLKKTDQPGGAFWGSAPNVPARPKTDSDRDRIWSAIVAAVHAYSWPAAMP